ncbi:hypothetical protein TNCV_3115361 [Trichonephila clavipes]|nr:hypothetical protein TNCV_3115361 [Trichonephila clavipes]
MEYSLKTNGLESLPPKTCHVERLRHVISVVAQSPLVIVAWNLSPPYPYTAQQLLPLVVHTGISSSNEFYFRAEEEADLLLVGS